MNPVGPGGTIGIIGGGQLARMLALEARRMGYRIAVVEATSSPSTPCVLKTRRSGYDGKGQSRVDRVDELDDAWRALGEAPALIESLVNFEKEIAVLLARGLDGNVRFHPIAENTHRRRILHTSRVPARIPADLVSQAEKLGAALRPRWGR